MLLLLAALAPVHASELGLDADVEVASAYVFRGLNIWGDSQLHQVPLLAPSLTWGVGDTGLYVGWWGAFQLGGPGVAANIDAGTGAEQDLLLGWDTDLSDDLGLSLGLVWYALPLADPDVAGTSWPSYLEPSVALTWYGQVDTRLMVAWFQGVQGTVSDYSYVYLEPSASRGAALSDSLSLDVGATAGLKLWTSGGLWAQNSAHLSLDASVTWTVAGPLYVSPGVHAGWTNVDTGATPREDFGEGFVAWASVHVGTDL